nr:cupin domain-containing protein [Streptomyces canus]
MVIGDAYADVIHRGEDPSCMRANLVRQSPSLVAGIALVQSRGGALIEAHPGEVIQAPPGGEHWHGPAPDRFMIRLAPWEADDATWLEHVAADDHNGPCFSTRTRP